MSAPTYFPEEIITKLLLPLPIKLLGRLSLVSKTWRSIITSRSFISSYIKKQRRQTEFLLRRYHNDREQFWLHDVAENKPFTINSSTLLVCPFSLDFGYFCIVGSCRGIVCLTAHIPIAYTRQPIFLWNPCTRKHLLLPVATLGGPEPHFIALGFGYSGDDDDDFKVVRFVASGETDDRSAFVSPPRAEVFTVRTALWRPIEVNEVLQNVRFAWSPVFLNGVVHWLAYAFQNGEYRLSVLRFWVAQERFDEMLLPDELKMVNYKNLSLTLMGESIAVINYNRQLIATIFDVWLMVRYGDASSWNKLYSLRTETLNPRLVALRQNQEALVANENYGLVAVDLENWNNTGLGILGAPHSFYVAEYVESLEPLSRD